jgi:tRNA threonylcarbamoyladenosine biosynthesis protein TsaE
MNISDHQQVDTHSPEETRQWASELARQLKPGSVIALHGDLGAGKTCFVKGLAEGLGINRPVTSPTFTLVNEYPGTHLLAHIDLYRLYSADDILASGLEDYFEPDGITVIEWAERADELLPPHTLHIFFEALDEEQSRRIRVQKPS